PQQPRPQPLVLGEAGQEDARPLPQPAPVLGHLRRRRHNRFQLALPFRVRREQVGQPPGLFHRNLSPCQSARHRCPFSFLYQIPTAYPSTSPRRAPAPAPTAHSSRAPSRPQDWAAPPANQKRIVSSLPSEVALCRYVFCSSPPSSA